MKKVFLLLVLLADFCYGQTTDVALPIGKSTFSLDANQRINWNGSNFKFDLGALKYSGNYGKNSQLHNFNFKISDMLMSYGSSVPKNTIGIQYKGFTFTSEDFTNGEIQNMFSSKIFVDMKNSFSYQQKNLSLAYTKTSGRFDVNSLSLQSKNNKLDYTESDKPLLMLDAWNRPYTSKTATNLQLTNLSARLMDTYTDIQYKDKNFGFRSIDHPTRSENSLNFATKNYSLAFTEFNEGYSKNFLNLTGKDFKFRMVNDEDNNISQLESKNTIIAYGNTESFIQSKYDDLEYRIASSADKLNYDFKLKNFGIRNGDTYGIISPVKNLDIKASRENGLEQVAYNATMDETKLALKYNNQFDISDFYFKQNVFSVYDNSFSMIGNSRTQFKESFSFNLNNPKFSLNSDVINDIYAFSFKNSNNLSFSMLKDQKQNFLNLANTGKNLNFGIRYNMNTSMFDGFSFNYTQKFK